MFSQHTDTMETATVSLDQEYHTLADRWTLWGHLPHNIDWSLKSYIPIATFSTVEETIVSRKHCRHLL